MATNLDLYTAAWLRLMLTPGIGPAAVIHLLRAFGSPEAALRGSAVQLSKYLTDEQVNELVRHRDEPLPPDYAVWLAETDNYLITLADSHYPHELLQIPDPPPVLFAKGSLELLKKPTLAVVGSRNATQPGIRRAERFSKALSDDGLTIVSGLAAGIDTAAHRGALEGLGSTIAVVGTGLDRIYPASNRDLAHAIAQRGLLLSEFPLGTPPLPANFPRRNRIISGLSLGCLVVEATVQSGSLITARLAAEQGREVFAIPGSIDSPQARGCHHLIKQGAKLVEAASDILDELRLPEPPASNRTQSEMGVAEVPAWLERLGFDPFDIDQACTVSGLTAGDVCAILFALEMDGKVASLTGGRFQRLS